MPFSVGVYWYSAHGGLGGDGEDEAGIESQAVRYQFIAVNKISQSKELLHIRYSMRLVLCNRRCVQGMRNRASLPPQAPVNLQVLGARPAPENTVTNPRANHQAKYQTRLVHLQIILFEFSVLCDNNGP